ARGSRRSRAREVGCVVRNRLDRLDGQAQPAVVPEQHGLVGLVIKDDLLGASPSEKSKVSPPISPSGCSQAASVNCPPSQVQARGNSRCWISAANDNGTERCPWGARIR